MSIILLAVPGSTDMSLIPIHRSLGMCHPVLSYSSETIIAKGKATLYEESCTLIHILTSSSSGWKYSMPVPLLQLYINHPVLVPACPNHFRLASRLHKASLGSKRCVAIINKSYTSSALPRVLLRQSACISDRRDALPSRQRSDKSTSP